MPIPEGTRLGDYAIVGPIGAGGMGEVYRARDLQLGRDVAIKVLPEEISGQNEPLARFQNEARLASSLNHPNIVTIYSIGREGHNRYIAMEFIDGPTLQQLFEAGPMPVDQALKIAAQIADGLAKAHEAGIVHRDLKPRNIMLTKDGLAKILDFGLSKLARTPKDFGGPTVALVDQAVTAPGTIMGTVEYMSPEQAAGRDVDFRSDQFCLGSLMYAILTGKTPFHRDTAVQTLSNIIEGEPPSIGQVNPLVPQSLRAVVQRCMMKDPKDRYASTRDLARDLGELQAPQGTPQLRTRREWIRAAVAVGVALAAATSLWIWNQRPYQPQPAALGWYEKGAAALGSMTFESARKAFEQAVAADPKFALAHASVARAYDELDYSERAKEAMLRAVAVAQETRLSSADQKRLRALQFMVSRDYERAAPLLRELEEAATGRDRPAAALESGWLAQQREDTEGAAAAYERALKMAPGYAAAWLRLGFIQGRRGQDEPALKSFTEAENLYTAASDYEGLTETLYQRANLLNRRSRAAEAMPVIERALSATRTMGSTYQQIRLQLLESTAARNLGEISRATNLAQQAIDTALTEKMGNLAISGLSALGNSFLVRHDLESAEQVFRRALDLAQRGKVRRYEALASLSLASVFEQRNRPEEAKAFIEAGLPFYRQAGYRRELVQSMILLGGVLQQLGNFDEGLSVLREALPNAIQLQDTQSEVRLRERLTNILQDKGAWPEALEESERTASLPRSSIQSGYALLNASGLYWRLGREQDAVRSLAEVEQLLKKTENSNLMSLLRLGRAEIAYASGRLEEARANARMSMLTAATSGDLAEDGARLIEALVSIRTSRASEGVASAASVIQKLEQARLSGNAATARLMTAEALAAAGNRPIALQMSREALAFFEPRQIWESVWRGHSIAAQVSLEPGDVEAHSATARTALAQLRKLWPAGTVDRYLQRPDIKLLAARIQ